MIYMPTTRRICLGNCIPHTSLSSYQNLPSALICDVCVCLPPACMPAVHQEQITQFCSIPSHNLCAIFKGYCSSFKWPFYSHFSRHDGEGLFTTYQMFEILFLSIGVLLHRHFALDSHEFQAPLPSPTRISNVTFQIIFTSCMRQGNIIFSQQ